MVLRIRDTKKRVETFLGMLDSAFINNSGKNNNLSDKLTVKFKKNNADDVGNMNTIKTDKGWKISL